MSIVLSAYAFSDWVEFSLSNERIEMRFPCKLTEIIILFSLFWLYQCFCVYRPEMKVLNSLFWFVNYLLVVVVVACCNLFFSTRNLSCSVSQFTHSNLNLILVHYISQVSLSFLCLSLSHFETGGPSIDCKEIRAPKHYIDPTHI